MKNLKLLISLLIFFFQGHATMNIHFILHESFESPGALKIWADKKGHSVSYIKLYEYQPLPTNTNSIDFLIIMGGPQSPATTLAECPYFDAQKEIALIKDAIDNNKLVLGVCLGAQLIGNACGASFEHSPHREIGVFPIALTPEAQRDPLFSKFPEIFNVGHWHGDMPGVPAGAQILATSKGCPRQIIKFTKRVYGFQCHFEFTEQTIDDMIKNCSQDLNNPGEFIFEASDFEKQDYTQMNNFLYRFLDQMESLHKAHL